MCGVLITAFQSEGKLYMVLNYLPGGELFYRLKREGRFSVERVRLYTAEIALGLGMPLPPRPYLPHHTAAPPDIHHTAAPPDIPPQRPAYRPHLP